MAKRNYICISANSLELDILDKPKDHHYVISLKSNNLNYSILENIILRNNQYQTNKSNKDYNLIYNDTLFSFVPPEPWLVAIGIIMWEGLLQNLTWESIKILIKSALKKIRFNGLLPDEEYEETKIKSKIKLGVSWKIYNENEKMQYELFLGLKKEFDKMTYQERKAVIKK